MTGRLFKESINDEQSINFFQDGAVFYTADAGRLPITIKFKKEGFTVIYRESRGVENHQPPIDVNPTETFELASGKILLAE
ncbi:MAG: hypothetical protein ACD_36C00171G0003 [uncultured bacterium]|uniref:Uncharacterized protein n=1 Tax=Candidatus Gottesmanbacteria bacterium RIFCSPLOWO2_01_FULL_43_11b TaxID=1798392 RepID=A0A1F6AJ98_9BACT|nr:MAG: hypothetical protein ACD_36C00171G0003 [uncultured bacterium]OGG24542.1 MAG: hypothetical protein A3A79_05150 [Candidatus Gottesmanbacteria bacterium RIFCSPLOWO2_01_FULL_43_11b]